MKQLILKVQLKFMILQLKSLIQQKLKTNKSLKPGTGVLIPNTKIMPQPTHEEIQESWEIETGTTAEGTSASGETTAEIVSNDDD